MKRILYYGIRCKEIEFLGKGLYLDDVFHYFGLQHFEEFECNEIYYTWVEVNEILETKIKEPMPSIKLDMLIEFMTSEKTKKEITSLCAYLACRSILGKKSYCKTNNGLILARMLGYSKIVNIPTELSPKLEEFRKPFVDPKGLTKKYQFNKLYDELELNWRILKYSTKQMRGVYIGYKDKTRYEWMKKAHELQRLKTEERKENLRRLKREL